MTYDKSEAIKGLLHRDCHDVKNNNILNILTATYNYN